MKTTMKPTLKNKLSYGLFAVFQFFLLLGFAGHGANTVSVSLQNCSSTSTTINFDLYITNTGDVTDSLNSFQAGIDFNYAGILNGGAISFAYVDGTTGL